METTVERRRAVPKHQLKFLQADANAAIQCCARKYPAEETCNREIHEFEDEQQNVADLASLLASSLGTVSLDCMDCAATDVCAPKPKPSTVTTTHCDVFGFSHLRTCGAEETVVLLSGPSTDTEDWFDVQYLYRFPASLLPSVPSA